MATEYGDRKAPTKADRGQWAPRIIIAFILLVVFIIMMDKDSYIGGRFNWSFLDVIGLIMFIAGAAILAGVGNWLSSLIAPKKNFDPGDFGGKKSKDNFWNTVILVIILCVGGLGLIYLHGTNF